MRKILVGLCALLLIAIVTGCSLFEKSTPKKVGISFGAGPAARWPLEKDYMVERAKELGLETNVRFNTTDKPKTQQEDCKELIDSGIGVLIVMPRDGTKFTEIVKYAQSKNVKVIAYARPFINNASDLFIGYDNYRIGQTEGLYAVEMVRKGNYIVLKGDKADNNSLSLYQGIMQQLQPALADGLNIILDDFVPGWSPDKAQEMVKQALIKNNKQVDVILAPNDKIAGASIRALKELNITKDVIVVGMDAELPAVQRIVNGEQNMTVYLNLKDLATTAVDQANSFINSKKFTPNSEFVDEKGHKTPSYLVSGKVVTKETIDKFLIETGVYTKEQVYGK